jgi:hypothetical protein
VTRADLAIDPRTGEPGRQGGFVMRRAPFVVSAVAALLAIASAAPVAAEEPSPGATRPHPIVGAWLAYAPGGPSVAVFTSDGFVLMGNPVSTAGPEGVAMAGTEIGTWERVDDRTAHFTATQLLSDEGRFTGSLTFEGFPAISEDGRTLLDDNTRGSVTVRDAEGNVVDVIRGGPPITGVRMTPADDGFAATGSPPAADAPTRATLAEQLERRHRVE